MTDGEHPFRQSARAWAAEMLAAAGERYGARWTATVERDVMRLLEAADAPMTEEAFWAAADVAVSAQPPRPGTTV